MADLSLTYTLTNGTTADADQVMADLNDIKTYINASTIRTDGNTSMAAALTLVGTDPTNAAHAVHKSYLDGPHVEATGAIAQNFTDSVYKTVGFATEVKDVTNGGTAATNFDPATGIFTVPKTGVYAVSFAVTPNTGSSNLWGVRIKTTSKTRLGDRIVPANIAGASDAVRLTQSTTIHATAAETIECQMLVTATASLSVGEWIAITWLHA